MSNLKKSYLLCSLLLMTVVPACRSESPPWVGPSERAVAAQEVLNQLERDPTSLELQKEFLKQFAGIFENDAVPWTTLSPATYTIYGEMMSRADYMSRDGCQPCLQAIMRASTGPLGRTSHGSEMLAEILWDRLLDQAQLSLNALAGLSPVERREVMAQVYKQPLHDNYDFSLMLAALQEAQAPPNIKTEVATIMAIVKRDAEIQAARRRQDEGTI